MATLTGKAAIWGVGIYGATATALIIHDGTGTPDPSGIATSADFERFSDIEPLQDHQGNTVGVCYYAFGKRLTVTAVPADRVTAVTESAAVSNQDNMLPAPSTTIYINDINSAIVDGSNTTASIQGLTDAARYVCTGSRLRSTNTGAKVVEMDLIQYEDYDISVAIS